MVCEYDNNCKKEKKLDKKEIKIKKDNTLRSLREVECFLNSFCTVKKGQTICKWLKK